MNDVLLGILIPFLGTTLGAGCVFFLRGKLNLSIERGAYRFRSRHHGSGFVFQFADSSLE